MVRFKGYGEYKNVIKNGWIRTDVARSCSCREKVENKQHEHFTTIERFDKRSHNCGGKYIMWQENNGYPSKKEGRIVIRQGEERWKPNSHSQLWKLYILNFVGGCKYFVVVRGVVDWISKIWR